jgi:hypothetical protein
MHADMAAHLRKSAFIRGCSFSSRAFAVRLELLELLDK